MSGLHIHAPAGLYHAQIRRAGCRNWEAVGEPVSSKKWAMLLAVGNMAELGYKRARVLFCAEWYDPVVVMEASV